MTISKPSSSGVKNVPVQNRASTHAQYQFLVVSLTLSIQRGQVKTIPNANVDENILLGVRELTRPQSSLLSRVTGSAKGDGKMKMETFVLKTH